MHLTGNQLSNGIWVRTNNKTIQATSPGIIIACKGTALDQFLSESAALIPAQNPQTKLTSDIYSSYRKMNAKPCHFCIPLLIAKLVITTVTKRLYNYELLTA